MNGGVDHPASATSQSHEGYNGSLCHSTKSSSSIIIVVVMLYNFANPILGSLNVLIQGRGYDFHPTTIKGRRNVRISNI